MNTERIKELLERYREGRTSLEEEKELRSLFSAEEVPPELRSWKTLFDYYEEAGRVGTDPSLDPLARIDFTEEKAATAGTPAGTGETGSERSVLSRGLTRDGMRWGLRAAAAVILLLTGFAGGLLVNRPASSPELSALQEEVRQMKEVLVYGSSRQTSASERISAINFSSRLPGEEGRMDAEVREILVWVMNNDQSVNVRLEAAEALNRYREQPEVRRALVSTLSRQESPVMQLTLIDMLVEMDEKSAINEMQKLIMKSDIRDVVQDELEAGIAALKSDSGN